ncbi:ATP-binding protein [Geodermatophilus sp. SYSU D00742]
MSSVPSPALSTAHIDYLQRTGSLALPLPEAFPAVPSVGRRLLLVTGVGRPGDDGLSAGVATGLRGAEAMLTGLYGERIPVAFVLSGTPAGIRVCLGTWADGSGSAGSGSELADARAEVLLTVLGVPHSAVTAIAVEPQMPVLPINGLVLGAPASGDFAEWDGATAVDRLLRAMVGGTWAAVILAEPVDEAYTSELRQVAVNEMRAAQAASLSSGAPSPLAAQYSELLQNLVTTLSHGLAVGAWRTAVYLGGDRRSYYRLSAAWRAVFSGPESLIEPLRIWTDRRAGPLAAGWALPYQPADPGPGIYRHPFRHQTLLTSTQLAACVHLPRTETTGFQITALPQFDVTPPSPSTGPVVAIGRVVERTQPTGTAYEVPVSMLTRHVFVAGVTGAGKTTTVRHLLQQLDAARVPYLVIEPAKREYRSIRTISADDGPPLVFTLGDERVAPFRLNPFEVPAGTTVGEHLDLIRSVFAASSGMWTPLPQVLERCLHQVYADRGFDPTTGRNPRLGPDDDPAAAFPTLSELSATVRRVVPTLGYDERVAADIRAALLTRLDSLRTGGKGLMLDGRRSTPLEALLDRHTVLELEPVADDDDKAFLMGLLLTRLVEHRRAQAPAAGLRHLVVIEEAHRLLSAPSLARRQEEADPRGKAAETFGHLLAELRAYGQGVLVADQVPTKLLPDVLKNTGLKIAHRTVAADDRAALGGAMAMSERQAHALATLPVGQAVIFGEGDDAGILVSVPSLTGQPSRPDAEIATYMAEWRRKQLDVAVVLPYDDCAAGCAADAEVCGAARRLVEDHAVRRAISRLALSAIDDPHAVDRLWPDVLAVLRARKQPQADEKVLLRSLAVHATAWLASRRGDQAGWAYVDTSALAAAMRELLLAHLGQGDRAESWRGYRELVNRLSTRTVPPYQACESVCDQQPPVCLYRRDVADLISSGEQAVAWQRADVQDAVSEAGRRQQSWGVALDAAYSLVEFPEPDWPLPLRCSVSARARRVALCFAQQALDADALKSPRTNRKITARLLAEADGSADTGPAHPATA